MLVLPPWITFIAGACTLLSGCATTLLQPALGSRDVPRIAVSALQFRDLNRNRALDPYEDWRLDAAARTRDLVARMTLAEKAGVMMHGTVVLNQPGSAIDLDAMAGLIGTRHVSTFITRQAGSPALLAAEHNKLQLLAEKTRLAIPVSISTDPRHHFQYVVGQSVASGGFSQWPEPLGMAAINDPQLTRRFGDIARQEYRAVGIHIALSPQADLATEPRWSRVFSTFGEDAEVARAHVQAYIEGFQDGPAGVGRNSVVAVVKHWAGYGAAKDGWDSHNPYGKLMTFPGSNFAYHLRPFDGAFAAKVGSVMPTYSVPEGSVSADGVTLEAVGGGFSKALITDLLRGRRGFDGVVLSDWAITKDCVGPCLHGGPPGVPVFAFFPQFGTPWGVEHLTPRERFVKAVRAGLDQFGGTEDAHVLVQAVQQGELEEGRLDQSVTRILLQKFRQGLFENPYADEALASGTVGTAAFSAVGLEAQRRSLVLLQNRERLLPLGSGRKKVYVHGLDKGALAGYGLVAVDSPLEADVAIVRINTPFELLHPNHIFGVLAHEGTLAYDENNADYQAVKRIAAQLPTVVTVNLERAAILTNIVDKAHAVVANFGVSDAALLDVLTGRHLPQGKLPIELPSSMAHVQAQRPDVPHDSMAPLFPIGFGLRY